MNKLISFALSCSVAALFCSCGSTGTEGEGGGKSAAPAPERGGSNSASVSQPFSDKTAAARVNRVENARVVVYQPKARGATMIMVNARNRDLAQREGRMRIAQGDPSQGFKRVSDLNIDNFLQSMEKENASVIREPFGPEHERMLRARPSEIPGFQGIIVIENDGQRSAYVGRRPQGADDAMGQEKYAIFANLKLVAALYYNGEGFVEYVDQAAGLGSGSGFDR